MKKRSFLLSVMLLLVTLIFVGCSTITPVAGDADFPPNKDYKILGRVDYQDSGFSIAYLFITNPLAGGYTELLKAAKEQYPYTDDVVNVIIDKKQTKILGGVFVIDTYLMSGIAIQYLED